MSDIELGDEVKDVITGFQGIAVARTFWLHGCDRIVIQPPVKEDGKHPDNCCFDEPCVEVIKKAKVKVDNTIDEKPVQIKRRKPGGDRDDRAASSRNEGAA